MVEYKNPKAKEGEMESKKANIFTKKNIAVLSIILVLLVTIGGIAVAKFRADKKAAEAKAKAKKAAQKSANSKSPADQKKLSDNNISRIKERVNNAQAKGSLSKDQANKVLKKLDEVAKFNSTLATKTQADQGKLIIDKRKELRDWARANNIPPSYVSMMIMRY